MVFVIVGVGHLCTEVRVVRQGSGWKADVRDQCWDQCLIEGLRVVDMRMEIAFAGLVCKKLVGVGGIVGEGMEWSLDWL